MIGIIRIYLFLCSSWVGTKLRGKVDECCYREYDYNDRIHGKGYDFSKYFYFVILMDSLTFEKINDLSDDKFMVILLYNEVILYLF